MSNGYTEGGISKPMPCTDGYWRNGKLAAAAAADKSLDKSRWCWCWWWWCNTVGNGIIWLIGGSRWLLVVIGDDDGSIEVADEVVDAWLVWWWMAILLPELDFLLLLCFSARASGVIKLSMVNALFGLGLVCLMVIVSCGAVVRLLVEFGGESGVIGRFGDTIMIVDVSDGDDKWPDVVVVRSSMQPGVIASLPLWMGCMKNRLILASAANSSFNISFSDLCSLKRFRRRSRLPFSNISNACGCSAQ